MRIRTAAEELSHPQPETLAVQAEAFDSVDTEQPDTKRSQVLLFSAYLSQKLMSQGSLCSGARTFCNP